MFSRVHRLAKEGDITRVLRKGRKFFDPFFTVRMLYADTATTARFAIVISTKVSKKATQRNRLRRILREVLRTQLASIRPGDYLIQVQPRIMQATEADQRQALLQLLRKSGVVQVR